MASHRHVTDEYVGGKSVSWLFSQFWSVQRVQWRQWTGMVTATEIALMRSLSAAFSGKSKLQPLPTWSEVSGEKRAKTTALATFSLWDRIERANTAQQDAQKDADTEGLRSNADTD